MKTYPTLWVLVLAAVFAAASMWTACASDSGDANKSVANDSDDDDDSGDDTTDDDVADDDADTTGLTDEQDDVCRYQMEWFDILCEPFGFELIEGPWCGDCNSDVSCLVWACFSECMAEDQYDADNHPVDCSPFDKCFKDCRGEYDPCYPPHPDYEFGDPNCP